MRNVSGNSFVAVLVVFLGSVIPLPCPAVYCSQREPTHHLSSQAATK